MKGADRAGLRLFGRLMAGSGVLAAGYPLLKKLPLSGRGLSDGLAIAGVLCLVTGLFRLVNRMGLFDSTRYGFKKLVELIRTRDYVPSRSAYPSLADYKEKHPYEKTYLPFLAAAAADMLLALLAG